MNCTLCKKLIVNNTKNRTRCTSCNTKIRRHRTKLAGIKYLGGVCKSCGFSNPMALQFHHRVPTEKEFNFGDYGNIKWEKLQVELDKCDILCANCHSIEHSTRGDIAFLSAVTNYNGRSLQF